MKLCYCCGYYYWPYKVATFVCKDPTCHFVLDLKDCVRAASHSQVVFYENYLLFLYLLLTLLSSFLLSCSLPHSAISL